MIWQLYHNTFIIWQYIIYLWNKKQFIGKFMEDLYVDDVTLGTKTIKQGKQSDKLEKNHLQKSFNSRVWYEQWWIVFQFEPFIYFEKSLKLS